MCLNEEGESCPTKDRLRSISMLRRRFMEVYSSPSQKQGFFAGLSEGLSPGQCVSVIKHGGGCCIRHSNFSVPSTASGSSLASNDSVSLHSPRMGSITVLWKSPRHPRVGVSGPDKDATCPSSPRKDICQWLPQKIIECDNLVGITVNNC